MPHGKQLLVLLLCWFSTVLIGGQAIAAEPATQPTGTVSGKVTSPGEVPLSEMVVYLEAPDGKREIVVPKSRRGNIGSSPGIQDCRVQRRPSPSAPIRPAAPPSKSA